MWIYHSKKKNGQNTLATSWHFFFFKSSLTQLTRKIYFKDLDNLVLPEGREMGTFILY